MVDLLWKKETFELHQIGECQKDLYFYIREWFLTLMKNPEREVSLSMKVLYYLLLDLKDMGEQLNQESFFQYQNSQIVKNVEEAIVENPVAANNNLHEQLELFLDVVENYRKKHMYEHEVEPMAKLAEKQVEGKTGISSEETEAFAKVLKPWEEQVRLIMCEELYAELIQENTSLSLMCLKLEWIAMEYGVLRAMAFLQWQISKELTNENMRTIVVLTFRMMGYNEEDIEEYMTEHFASSQWEWGYYALVVG